MRENHYPFKKRSILMSRMISLKNNVIGGLVLVSVAERLDVQRQQ